jgi:glycosyltransferase involved in cell wall biosynthesis
MLFFKKINKAIKIFKKHGLTGLVDKIKEKFYVNLYQLTVNQQYQIWLKKNYPTKKDLERQRKESKKFKYKPLISIITPVYNPEKEYLIECIESVISQSYENWELCLVDDASTKKYVAEILKYYQKKDQRIKVKFRKTNGHICRASNDALQMASGEYIGLLDHDDFLWPSASYEVVKLLNKKPHAQFIYSDEDKLDYDGKTHVDPFFKPDWSPDYLRSINYVTHFALLKKDLVEKVGGFRVGTEGAQDWDLFLRATWWLEKNISHCHPLDPKNPIQHISTILYSWRKSSTSTASEKTVGKVKSYAYINQVKVVKDHLKEALGEDLSSKLEVRQSKNLGLIRVKIKDENLLKKVKKNLKINFKKESYYIAEEYCFVPFLFKRKIIVVPLKNKGNYIYDFNDKFLFFKNASQPFPNLFKKDSFFDYCSKDVNDFDKISKLGFIIPEKITLTKNNINNFFIITNPYFSKDEN